MWLLRGFSSYLLISCMGKRWHPDKSSFTSAQRKSYVCWNFLEKMSCRLLGGGTNAGNTSPSVAQRPGKAVFWHLDIHPGEGLQYSGAHGASEDRRSMGGGVGGNDFGCFLCNHPRSDWSQLQTAHFSQTIESMQSQACHQVATSPDWGQIFLFSNYKSQLLAFSQLWLREVRG